MPWGEQRKVRVLAGDIGGTKTFLSLFEYQGGICEEVRRERFSSADHRDLESVLEQFIRHEGEPVDGAAFGVAGPVVDDHCSATNLPWHVHGATLAALLRVPRAVLVNDFVAVAHGIAALDSSEVETLQDGDGDRDGVMALLGAGTGLGEAVAIPGGGVAGGLRVLASEGGHADFAPRNEVEMGLLRRMLQQVDRVSVERLVSGPGLVSIYEYVVMEGLEAEVESVRAQMAPSTPGENALVGRDPAAVIGAHAMAGTDPACAMAVDLFVQLYGAEAGNLALKVIPTGGVYVAGGMAAKLLPALREGAFVEAFLNKGRMRPLLERIPVRVIKDPRVGLLGARSLALASCTGA